tara:strand:- start:86 stop:451 length:366 start_codon:yes stop_codon:yes gene_type:complete
MNGPGLDEVIEIVKNHKHFKDIDIKKYNDLIEKVVQDEFIKYSGFGSYRGFYTFTLHTLVNNVEMAILNKIKYNIAFRKLTQSTIIKQWVNHVLYRMPENSSLIGLRVIKHKINFNNSRIV